MNQFKIIKNHFIIYHIIRKSITMLAMKFTSELQTESWNLANKIEASTWNWGNILEISIELYPGSLPKSSKFFKIRPLQLTMKSWKPFLRATCTETLKRFLVKSTQGQWHQLLWLKFTKEDWLVTTSKWLLSFSIRFWECNQDGTSLC